MIKRFKRSRDFNAQEIEMFNMFELPRKYKCSRSLNLVCLFHLVHLAHLAHLVQSIEAIKILGILKILESC